MNDKAALLKRANSHLEYAYIKHGRDKWGRHEFYAVLLEEVDELWNAIKADGTSTEVIYEMADIIAVVLRYYETGNRHGEEL